MGVAASFNNPAGVAIDASGSVYVADRSNNLIRKISPAGNVSTFAGSGTGTFADGVGVAASFFRPYGVAVDSSGIVYVADYTNNRVRRINPSGNVTTLAGSGLSTPFANGVGVAASFRSPY